MALSDPDRIIQSKTDVSVALYYKFFEATPVTSKHLCIVVKAATDNPFIITMYFTDSVKKGEVIWERN